MDDPELPAADVLGVEMFVGTIESAAEAVIARALSGQGGYAVLCNVHVLMTARKRVEVMTAVQRAWSVFPDGAPVAWMMRRDGNEGAKRVGGPDLMPIVLDRGREGRLRHALFGSTPAVVRGLQAELHARFPGIEIVSALAPPIGTEEAEATLQDIRNVAPDIVWLALGAPKQELWMQRHASGLSPAVVLGVGAAFDFHAGTKKRAPRWMRTVGMEWAHRLASEPRRLGLRYATTNSAFAVSAGRQVIARRRTT